MSDEEIEYLGACRGSKQGLQRVLTGIALNVEKSANSDAYRLVYRQGNGSTILIGRRPGGDSTRTQDTDSGSAAMFRCAVVSRKHAEIAFADNGNVYVVDTNSHHGTHVRKSGQLTSEALVPKRPMLLSDGDVITFGKTVGRGEECVSPVVVRVEFLRNPQPIKPLFVPSLASGKSSSGRYGIYTSSGSSDEMLDDIVETSPFATEASRGTRVFDSVRNVLKDGNSNRALTFSPATLAPIDPWNSIVNLPSLNDVVGFNLSQTAQKSRSHSPMDLESPAADEPAIVGAWPSSSSSSSDRSECTTPPHRDPPTEGVRIAHKTTSISRDVSPMLSEDVEGPEDGEKGADSDSGLSEAGSSDMVDDTSSRESSPEDIPLSSSDSELKEIVEKLQVEIDKIRIQRRKYHSQFKNDIRAVAEKMAEYDQRVDSLTTKHAELTNKIELKPDMNVLATITADIESVQQRLGGVIDLDVPALQAKVNAVDKATSKLSHNYDEILAVRDKVNGALDEIRNEFPTLRSIIDEMTELRQKTQKHMDLAVKEVHDVSDSTLAKIEREVSTRQTLAPSTSKRKRDDSDDDNAMERIDWEDPPAAVLTTPADLTMAEPETLDGTAPPRKRLRRLASVMAHTATAVTIGAVATWSALAFA